jgi:5-methylcytosine-specific restriction endonuclease McrA
MRVPDSLAHYKRTCNKCKIAKPLENFPYAADCYLARRSTCTLCKVTAKHKSRFAGTDSNTLTNEQWRKTIKFFRGRCVYCLRKLNTKTIVLEHVVPKSVGGANMLGNVVPACNSCNISKANPDKLPKYIEKLLSTMWLMLILSKQVKFA